MTSRSYYPPNRREVVRALEDVSKPAGVLSLLLLGQVCLKTIQEVADEVVRGTNFVTAWVPEAPERFSIVPCRERTCGPPRPRASSLFLLFRLVVGESGRGSALYPPPELLGVACVKRSVDYSYRSRGWDRNICGDGVRDTCTAPDQAARVLSPRYVGGGPLNPMQEV